MEEDVHYFACRYCTSVKVTSVLQVALRMQSAMCRNKNGTSRKIEMRRNEGVMLHKTAVYVYTYNIYMYVYICVWVYIHIYINIVCIYIYCSLV